MVKRSPCVCLCSTQGVGRTPGMFSIEGNIIGTVGAIMSTPGASVHWGISRLHQRDAMINVEGCC